MTNDEIEQALEQMKISIAEIEKQLGIDINVEPPPASHPEVYGGLQCGIVVLIHDPHHFSSGELGLIAFELVAVFV